MAIVEIPLSGGHFMSAMGFEKITISTSVVGFTTSLINNGTKRAWRAFITVETAGIRFRYDGGNPAVDTGHLAPQDTEITIEGVDDVANFKMIRATGVNATIFVTYETY